MKTSIFEFIEKHQLLPTHSIVLLGLSGGPDSIFLLHFLAPLHAQGTISLIAAHLNHEWRSSAEQDMQFCADLCEQLNIPFVSKKLSELDISFKYNGSKEEFARKARRSFFEQLANKHKATAIALAHHVQDQQETFFIRLLRGTSLSGLIGMKPREGLYIRPLLETNKEDIINYLHEHKLSYCIDETNASNSFLRNRIRHKVLPVLHEVDERFNTTFQATLKRLHETENFLEQQTQYFFGLINIQDHGQLMIDYKKLLSLHSIMRYRCILYWFRVEKIKFPVSQAFFDELLRFLSNTKKEHYLHHEWKIRKDKKYSKIIKI